MSLQDEYEELMDRERWQPATREMIEYWERLQPILAAIDRSMAAFDPPPRIWTTDNTGMENDGSPTPS